MFYMSHSGEVFRAKVTFVLLLVVPVFLCLASGLKSQSDIFKYEGNLQSRLFFQDSPDIPVTNDTNTDQAENSIFVSPVNPNIVFNSNVSRQRPLPQQFYGVSGFTSTNGGINWFGKLQLVQNYVTGGNPTAVIDMQGRYYIAHISPNTSMEVSYSDDGSNWLNSLVPNSDGGVKPNLIADNSVSSPYQGNLYIVWAYRDPPGGTYFSRSTNRGISWSAPYTLSTGLGGEKQTGPNVQTGINGEIYAVWAVQDTAFITCDIHRFEERALAFAKSTNGGLTFSPPRIIMPNIRGVYNCMTFGKKPTMKVYTFPVMAVDNSSLTNGGSIYVVWPNIGAPGVNTGEDIDVYMIRSTNGGANWNAGVGQPVRVNQDPSGLGKQHLHPWITCDPVTGNLSVIYYDDRNSPDGSMVDVYVANSSNSGNTWIEVRVNDPGTTFNPTYVLNYIAISARGGRIYPCWTSNHMGDFKAMTYVSPYNFSSIKVDPLNQGKVPEKFRLYQNYPNPFNPKSKIKIEIAKLEQVQLIIYDVLGREVAVLIPPLGSTTSQSRRLVEGGQEGLKPGTYEIEWDASNYPSGIYLCKFTAGDFTESKRMVLLK
jgi:hypothetical protein